MKEPVTTAALNYLLARRHPTPMFPNTLSTVISVLRLEERELLYHGISVTISEAKVVEHIGKDWTLPPAKQMQWEEPEDLSVAKCRRDR